MSFLEYLEKTCPGDDAHDGYGEKRPLLERCGMCRGIYEEHQKEVAQERDRALAIVEKEIAMAETVKKPKYLWNAPHAGCFVRAWAESRGRNKEYAIQVWMSGKPEGEPDGDWGMPGFLPLDAAIDQAILNTKGAAEKKAKKTD